ncbi:hypothetical protein L1049_009408 [Liquidambar formosana]|uniref:Disease resistance protein RGA3 n=1 Tax=Liquidambar formosana TaxID=63359 RepID=A0AAP0X9Y9_LIQFO
MAETILSSLAEGVLGKLVSLVEQEIVLVGGVKSEIKKLECTFSAIRAVLSDAEKQQTTNHAVRDWLEKLKDVVYDVDDVLDELSTEALRRKVEIHGSKLKEVSNFFSRLNPIAFRFKIGHKIKEIRGRLDDIAKDRREFQFSTEQAIDAQVEKRVREQTHSYVQESDVIGRENDKEQIIKILLESNNDESLSVIPIVGLGGLGKTTLAKLVYNDGTVVQNFELRMWVCVSEDFDIKKLIEKILESILGVHSGYTELDPLQSCLRENLNAKKFLLVLDDVWNEDFTKWRDLKSLMMSGASGSRIIVTTRIMTIASFMGTITPYKLGGLSHDECLSILVKYAFEEGHEKWHPKLVEIGKEIVTKCGGIPLAVQTLGSLLYMKTEEHEWLYIKDNDIWKLEQKENDILAALRLSYQQLPSYLKQCFAYCSIFPKNYEILRRDLIYLWMAQGLIQSPTESQQLEDIANQYCNELRSRSFFQELETNFDDKISSYKIHDLLVDIAQQVAGTEWLKVDFNSKVISERVRHVLFAEKDLFEKELPKSLISAKKLRSFTFSYKVGSVGKPIVETLISSFPFLRVLDLSGSEFEELPNFVGKLKHLRYLCLLGNGRLKTLPNSICKLLNLQSLDIMNCDQLEDLPRDIGKLVSLRYLRLTAQLICMPEKGLLGLTSLRTLVLSKLNRLTSLSEGIQHLTSLRSLHIEDCPSLPSLPSGMRHLTALEKLEIWDCEELKLIGGEDMQGLSSLRSLTIAGLRKLVALPLGLQHSATSLQYLYIGNCRGLTMLPDWLQALKSLEVLYIIECPNILSLPEGIECLTNLRELVIEKCPHLSRRCKMETGEDWAKISHIPRIYIESAWIQRIRGLTWPIVTESSR